MKSIVVICLLICNITIAQSSVNSSGGEATGSGGSASFSVGEVVYSNFSSSSGSVMEGIQFPFEVVTLSASVFDQDIQLLVYPNPVINALTLKVQNQVFSDLEYQLFDSFGKLLESKKNLKPENQITVDQFSSSLYFLKVFRDGKEVKVFKIIKN